MITSKPVSEARLNRGTGINHLGGIGEGKCNARTAGTYVYTDNGWERIDQPEVIKDAAYNRDYELCRRTDKVMDDYRRHKDKRDREKIMNEFEGIQREYRRPGNGLMEQITKE